MSLPELTVPMKALSLHEPWASMIADGRKTIETRMWPTSYRGPLIICATHKPIAPRSGQIVAITQLIDCRQMAVEDVFRAHCPCEPGRYAFVLRGTVLVSDAFVVSGAQRLWTLWDHEGGAIAKLYRQVELDFNAWSRIFQEKTP